MRCKIDPFVLLLASIGLFAFAASLNNNEAASELASEQTTSIIAHNLQKHVLTSELKGELLDEWESKYKPAIIDDSVSSSR